MSSMKYDPQAYQYCVELNEECWALDNRDGWYYLAILNEVNDRASRVTFIANQSVKNASYSEQWVSTTDVFNLCWGLHNCPMMYDKSQRNYEYANGYFAQMIDQTTVLLQGEGHTSPRVRVHYDRLRLSKPPYPMYPYSLMVRDIVKGILPWEQDYEARTAEMIEIQTGKMRDAWGTLEAREFEAFGRTLTISAASANEKYLKDMADRLLPICTEIYTDIYKKRDKSEFRFVLNGFDNDLNKALKPVFSTVDEEFGKAGLYFPLGRFINVYAEPAYDYNGFYTVFLDYNKRLEKYNKAVREYNSAAHGTGSEMWHDWETYAFNPETITKEKTTFPSLLESVQKSVVSVMCSAFPRAVNDYLGIDYFNVMGDSAQKPYTQRAYQESFEFRCTPEGLELLLKALEESPADADLQSFIYIYHSYKGCGLNEIVDYVGGEGAAQNLKRGMLEKWMSDWGDYSVSGAVKFIEMFDERWDKYELTEDNGRRVQIFRNWVENLYIIRSVALHPYLKRLNGMTGIVAPDEYVNHSVLSGKVHEAVSAIEADSEDSKRLSPGNEKYRLKLIDQCLALSGLISTDSDYVMGKEISDEEGDPDEIRDEIEDIIEMYRNMDFGRPTCVSEIEAAVNAHKRKSLLQQLIDKARRAKELSAQIDLFLYETANRVYTYRQDIAYDIMRARVLDCERSLLDMSRDDLWAWQKNNYNNYLSAFGEDFNYATEADARYFEIMERAWIYQDHLNEKNDEQRGLFKKLSTAVSGVSKKQYEPDYMLATANGTRPLAPLAENEMENIRQYWEYADAENKRLTLEYQQRYDPDAIEQTELMDEFINEINALCTAKTLKEMAANSCL